MQKVQTRTQTLTLTVPKTKTSLPSMLVLTCICILMMALPMSVAPKNVQKGMRKWPQVIPARSNRGLGICNREKKTEKC